MVCIHVELGIRRVSSTKVEAKVKIVEVEVMEVEVKIKVEVRDVEVKVKVGETENNIEMRNAVRKVGEAEVEEAGKNVYCTHHTVTWRDGRLNRNRSRSLSLNCFGPSICVFSLLKLVYLNKFFSG